MLNHKNCPICGMGVKLGTVECPDCGHEFRMDVHEATVAAREDIFGGKLSSAVTIDAPPAFIQPHKPPYWLLVMSAGGILFTLFGITWQNRLKEAPKRIQTAQSSNPPALDFPHMKSATPDKASATSIYHAIATAFEEQGTFPSQALLSTFGQPSRSKGKPPENGERMELWLYDRPDGTCEVHVNMNRNVVEGIGFHDPYPTKG